MDKQEEWQVIAASKNRRHNWGERLETLQGEDDHTTWAVIALDSPQSIDLCVAWECFDNKSEGVDTYLRIDSVDWMFRKDLATWGNLLVLKNIVGFRST